MISVIVPLYKGNKYIPQLQKNLKLANDNFKRQCNDTIEVIFVNDYPEENVFYDQNVNYNVQLIRHCKNQGIHAARVTGLKYSSGSYILFLDQDDYIDVNYFVVLFNGIRDNDIIICNGYRDYEEHKELLYKRSLAHKLVMFNKVYIYGTDMIFSPGQCLIKKTAIPSIWKENILNISGCDDFFLWILMFKSGCKFCISKSKLYFHRENKYNYSGSSERMNLSFRQMVDIIDQLNIIKKEYINALNIRYDIKTVKSYNKKKLIKILICNPKVLFFTILYKICGYR